ncbi:MAG: YlmC/YmxH family sporulation protein [Clostridiales bacterium]|nr:YlmC/YmxH family sporulation protein [Clostridiales bacterium]
MSRIYDMRRKEVINIKDGCRFGFLCDLEIDDNKGEVKSIIVPGPGRIFGAFGQDLEYRIPWEMVCQIGDDIILVNVESKSVLTEC